MKDSVQSFRQKVYALTSQIPKGKVMTYGQIAQLVGSPGAARAVGVCMKENSDPKSIPCHRVVVSNGNLTGYAFGQGIITKQQLLENEGVKFKDDRVDLLLSQWKTSTTKKLLSAKASLNK